MFMCCIYPTGQTLRAKEKFVQDIREVRACSYDHILQFLFSVHVKSLTNVRFVRARACVHVCDFVLLSCISFKQKCDYIYRRWNCTLTFYCCEHKK